MIAIINSGCVIVPKPSAEELKLLDNPPVELTKKIDALMPLVIKWFNDTENNLYPKGRHLTNAEKKRAKELGVHNPDQVRVVILDKFPMPTDKVLLKKAKSYGLGSIFEGGRTMGNVILLKPKYKDNSIILSHELVHVAQYDRMGYKNFLRRYLIEMEIMGYSRSPLELEAYDKQKKINANP
jgi:hypothetical protein